MAHTVLSLDLAANVGWCLAEDGIIKYSGTKSFYKPNQHPGAKWVAFHDWLLKFRGVTEVFYEDVVRHVSKNNARSYCGFLTMLQVFTKNNGIQSCCLKPNSVKLGFTGNGRADKEEMCKVAHQLGWLGGELGTANNNDEADACAVYFAIMRRRGQEPSFAKLPQVEIKEHSLLGHNHPPSGISE